MSREQYMPRQRMAVAICSLTIWLCSMALLSAQPPLTDQEWHHNVALSSDTLTIACAAFTLPVDIGQVVSDADPFVTKGTASLTLSSAHFNKITLQPEAGTSDTLSTISGCAVDGALVMLTTEDLGDTITITDSGNINTPGADVVIDNPEKVRILVLIDGEWRFAAGTGSGGGVEVDTLASVFLRGNTASPAPCATYPLTIDNAGDDSINLCISATEQPSFLTTCDGGPCSYFFDIPSGEIMQFLYAGTVGQTIDSSGNMTLAGNMKRRRAPWIGAGAWSSDGTQCLEWADTSFNGAPLRPAITCADNDASTITTSAVLDSSWDAGTFEVRAWIIATAGTPAGIYHFDWAIQCRGSGEVADNTWGTEQSTVWNLDAGGDCGGSACPQWAELRQVSAAITAAGGCQKNDRISVRGQINAAATTAPNVSFLGINLGFLTDNVSD